MECGGEGWSARVTVSSTLPLLLHSFSFSNPGNGGAAPAMREEGREAWDINLIN